MRLSGKVAVEFAAVFLIGVVVGGLVVWDFRTDSELTKFMSRTNDSDTVIIERINKKYTEEYHLTPEELQKIQPLIKEMAQHISHVRRQFGADIVITYTEYHQKMAEQLTPEHRALYEKATSDRVAQLKALLKLDQDAQDQGQK